MIRITKRIAAIGGAAAVLIGGGASIAACGGSAPNAASIVQSDGYTVHSNASIGVTNTDPANISSEAWGTNGNGAEIVVVTTSQGQQQIQSAVSQLQALNTGLTISSHGDVVKIDGTLGTFASLGGSGL